MRILLCIVTMSLAACTATTQTTSGADYLARYSPRMAARAQAAESTGSIDAQVRDIAAIEPDLRFPARIGIARIENGILTATPEAELMIWSELATDFGGKFGEFIPVSPMIAAMVRPLNEKPGKTNVINDIRRGAARQHIDYVLSYEVINQKTMTSNALSIADISIIGLFVLPSRDVKVVATANAILLDVRNGYPYGTAGAVADETSVARVFYSGDEARNMSDKANFAAVLDLAEEVEIMFQRLLLELAVQE
jgi:hypothetical protein